MSPVMTDRQSVAANSVVANALSGKTNEFITEPSVVRFYGTAATTGLFMTCLVGDEVIVEDQEISAANRMPIVPDDVLAEGGGVSGDRVVVKLRNSSGAAIIVFTRVDVDPI